MKLGKLLQLKKVVEPTEKVSKLRNKSHLFVMHINIVKASFKFTRIFSMHHHSTFQLL